MTVFAGKETKNGREETSRRLDGLPERLLCVQCASNQHNKINYLYTSMLQINTTR